MVIDEPLVKRLLCTVDAGLRPGVGVPIPGQMCVEAAVCYAMGLPHGDDPSCVSAAVRRFKINLNDAAWSSEAARAKGMRKLAVAQLGSKGVVDDARFATLLAEKVIREFLPVVLRKAGLNAEADRCAEDGNYAAAYAAAQAADAAAQAAQAAQAADAAAYAAYAAYAAAQAAQAAYAAADAAYAAADAAAQAAQAADAAYAAADAAAQAAQAAQAAYAAADAAAYAADEYLSLVANLALDVLIELKSPGTEWLHLCD